MENNNCWKQPIPTNLNNVFGEDQLCRLIYIELLLRARNTDTPTEIGNMIVFLKRGQAVCGEVELGRLFNRNRKTIKKALNVLNRIYNRTDNTTTTRGTIVTIRNYDEVVKMDNRTDNRTDSRGTAEGQPRDTNKSVKSVKSVKSDEGDAAGKVADKSVKGAGPPLMEIPPELKDFNPLRLTGRQVATFCREFSGLGPEQIKEEMSKCNAYMQMSSNNYSNPGLFFRGWLKNAQGEYLDKQKRLDHEKELQTVAPPISEEQRLRNIEKIKEIKEKFKLREVT
jgi:hypothetical protein